MKCAVIDKKTKKHIDEVRESLASSYIDISKYSYEDINDQIATAIGFNEGHNLTKNRNGEPSKTYNKLLKLYNGNKQKALAKRYYMFTPNFVEDYGYWYNESEDVVINDNNKIEMLNGVEKSIYWDAEKKFVNEIDKPENNIKELDKALSSIMDYLGVEVREVGDIVDERGTPVDAVGKADMINRTIDVVKGKAGKSTLREEQFHFITELIPRDSELWKDLTRSIKLTDEYKQTVNDYSDIAGYNEEKLISESVAKWLANSVDSYSPGKQQDNPRGNMLSRVLDWFTELFEPFLSSISPSIVDKYRSGSTSNVAELVADKIISGELLSELKDVSELPKEVFYDLNTESQAKVRRALNSRNVELVEDENGDSYYQLTKPNSEPKKIWKRVTEIANELAKGIYGERTYPTFKFNGKEVNIYADKGTYVHSHMEHIFRAIVNGAEVVKSEIIELSKQDLLSRDPSLANTYNDDFFITSDHDFNEMKKLAQSIYDNAKSKQEAFGGKIEDIDWYFEKAVVNEKTEVAGTIDLMIVYSNGVTDIYDYKSTNVEHISPEKIMKYNSQLSTHVDTLKTNYGVKDIGAVRIVPIHIKLDISKGEIKSLKNKAFRAIPNKADMDTYEGLSQIPLVSEKQYIGELNEDAKTKIDDINKAYDVISKQLLDLETKIGKERDRKKREKLESQYKKRVKYMQDLAITGDVSALFLQVYNLANMVDKQISLSSTSKNHLTKDDLVNYKHSLDNAKSIIDNLHGALGYEIKDESFELSEEDIIKARVASSMVDEQLSIVNSKLEIIEREAYGDKAIDSVYVVDNKLTSKNRFGALKEIIDPTVEQFNRIVEGMQSKTARRTSKLNKELTDLMKSFDDAGFKRSVFKRLVNNNRVVGEYSKEFWEDRNKFVDESNVNKLKKMFTFNKEKFEEAQKDFKTRTEAEISKKAELSEEQKSDELSRAMKNFNKKHNPNTNVGAYRSSAFLEVNPGIDSKYLNQDYVWLNQPENKPVKDVYDFFLKVNSDYRNYAEGYESIEGREDPVHRDLAFVDKSVADAIFEGDLNFSSLRSKAIESMLIKDYDEVLGDTANDVKQVPQMLLHPYQAGVTNKQKNDIKHEILKEGFKEGTKKYNEELSKRLTAQGYKNSKNNVTIDLIEQAQALIGASVQYQERKNVESDLKDLIEIMANRKFYKENSEGNPSKEISEVGVENVDGRRLLQDFMDMEIYGRHLKSDVRLFGTNISLSKTIGKAGSVLSTKALPLKFTLAIAQAMGGMFQTYVSSVEGSYHSRKTLKDAMKKVKSKEDMNKVAGLANFLDVRARGNTDDLRDAAKSNWAKRNLTNKNLFFMYSLTDDKLDDIRIDSMANFWKIKDDKLVHPSKLDNPEDYPSFYDAVSVNNETGEVSLNEKYVSKENEDYVLGDFRGKVFASIKKDRGAESSDYKSRNNRTILMQLLMKFRNWIPGLAAQRFQKTNWSGEFDIANAGRYAVVFGDIFMKKQGDETSSSYAKRMINQLMAHSLSSLTFGKITPKLSREATEYYLKKAMNNPEFADKMNDNFESMDDMIAHYQKIREQRAKGAAIEFGAMIWMGLLMLGWKAIDDEEDESAIEGAIEDTMTRFVNELTTFVNPTQYTSLYQNSVPLFQEMIKLTKFGSNTVDLGRDLIMGQDQAGDRSGFGHYGKKLFVPQLPKFLEEKIWYKVFDWIKQDCRRIN